LERRLWRIYHLPISAEHFAQENDQVCCVERCVEGKCGVGGTATEKRSFGYSERHETLAIKEVAIYLAVNG
jgi:hypothetical protein